ncbi:M20/M25/M40 family metallo-hydrolase [Bacillus sp. 03113]|uniref:M20/M25/M40 family metallo-hydrolase n=1 Tax=Bacillus sp. 03113 TaxID=2578211 RepID=UPI001143EA23|nr:M20/M25/M40 family metallo-hydrolase [Bacillus sp. 03113]
MLKWQTKEQLTKLLCNLVEIPSITGSEAEIYLPDFVIGELSSLEYFKQHPEHLKKNPTGDGRYFVTGLVKKNPDMKKTVILVSHFDVVDVQDYGRWKEDAFNPEKLTQIFYSQKDELPKQVRNDVESGNWLFGRGTMDMKCGLALHMAMIEQACEGAFDGNILLLTVPDEEVNSVGMRAAVPVLLEMADKFNLEYTTVLNGEPMFMRYPGDQKKYIYTGTIGKVLPGFLCYGKETHVGEPFAGLNANYMASLLTDEFELNTELCDIVEGEITPPPTNLIQHGIKEEYSVQIPHRAVTLCNLFILDKTMDDVVSLLRDKAEKVANVITESYTKQVSEFSKYTPFGAPDLKITVLTYDELTNYAIKNYGVEMVNSIQSSILNNRGEKDDREVTIEIADKLTILCKELAPMIVIFFAPPYYPAISSYKHPLIKDVVEKMEKYANEFHDISFEKINYFNGISDLSYVGLQHPVDSMKSLTANMPLWDKGYSVPLRKLELFDVPVLNMGPVGFDAHQWTERLDLDYAFETLMDMLPVCINSLLTPSAVTN